MLASQKTLEFLSFSFEGFGKVVKLGLLTLQVELSFSEASLEVF